MSNPYFLKKKDSERQYFLFVSALKKHVKDLPDSSVSLVKEKLEEYEELGQMQRDITFLLDIPISKFFFISRNIQKILGFSKEEIMEWGFAKMMFKTLPASQLMYPLLNLGWYVRIDQLQTSKMGQLCVCGMQLKNKLGKKVNFIAQLDVVAYTASGASSIGICTLKEITHLVKPNVFWVRYLDAEGNPLGFFKPSRPLKRFSDILTAREKEVLTLLPDSSEQIAKQLGIEASTVVKHRKNMLTKTGARDTTALIQLCKMCNII